MSKVDDASRPTPSAETGRVEADWQGDPLSGFPAEAEVAAAARSRTRRAVSLVAAGVLTALLLVAAGLGWRPWPSVPARPAPGTVTVESGTPGVQVFESGRELGVTPLTLSLPPGAHLLVLRRGTARRDLDVEVRSGVTVVHHVALDEAPRAASLRVDTSPPGATVEVDGTPRGMAPVEISGLEPGEHDVTVRRGSSVVAQKVTIPAGGASSLTVPLAFSDAAAAGWVAVSSPIELQLYEGESLVGNSRMTQVMLPVGRRTLRMVNEEAGFETQVRVQIRAGAVTRLPVTLPIGQLSVNAAPWAEVFLDGRRIGETPIANFAVPIGSHEIILRHPRYAEQRRTVVVSLASPVRLGVDFRQ